MWSQEHSSAVEVREIKDREELMSKAMKEYMSLFY
jgi:hypothetical protein